MSTPLYFDVHIPASIADQLRLRGVDVLRAQDDNAAKLPDDQLLDRADALGRVLFTFDARLKGMAEEWQRASRDFSGLFFGKADASIGSYVKEFELISKASDISEWKNRIEFVPS